eukprot:scaffold678_cov98-Cylindrotheca_fusiformis.AAC.2
MSSKKQPFFRRLEAPSEGGGDGSPHFLPALQLIAHIVTPIRKGLVHFYLQTRSNESLELEEWIFLRELGRLLQAMILAPPTTTTKKEAKKDGDDGDEEDDEDDEDEDDEEPAPAVDTSEFYKALGPCLEKLDKPSRPKDATQAVQILLDTIQACTQIQEVTGELWSTMLDSAGTMMCFVQRPLTTLLLPPDFAISIALGFVARQTMVGKAKLEDGDMLQRTKKEALILACPYIIPSMEDDDNDKPKKETGDDKEEEGKEETKSIDKLLKQWWAKQPHEYDFDTKSFDFEVKIPTFNNSTSSSTKNDMGDDWITTRSLQFASLQGYLFLGLSRLDEEDELMETQIEFPKRLDLSKLCTPDFKGKNKEYELCGAVLYDDGDYVAALKNPAIEDPEEEGAWQLMESEEIIPMEEEDILEFLKGEGGGEGPAGTLAVYKRCHEPTHTKMNDVLSDIIISQASGKLNAQSDFYYEEEVVEEEVVEEE